MTMRAANSPRRVYVRHGAPLICFGGVYFGPGKDITESKIDADHEVKVEVLDAQNGRKQIKVTQTRGAKKASETWTQKKVTFEPRAEKAAKATKKASSKKAAKPRAKAKPAAAEAAPPASA